MMNDFLKALIRSLKHMSTSEKQEILDDYKEHFEAGLASGKTEQQIAQALGDPKQLAKMYSMLNAANKAHETRGIFDSLRMIGAALSYKAGGGLIVGALYFVCLTVLLLLFAAVISLGLLGAACIGLTVAEFIHAFVTYGLLAFFAAMMFVPLSIMAFIGLLRLWKITLGQMPLLARRVMRHTEQEV